MHNNLKNKLTNLLKISSQHLADIINSNAAKKFGAAFGFAASIFGVWSYYNPYEGSKSDNYIEVNHNGGSFCLSKDKTYELNKIAIATDYFISSENKSFDSIQQHEQYIRTSMELLTDAYQEIEESSAKGNYYAMYWNGFFHQHGLGGAQKDLTKAETYYKKSMSTIDCSHIFLIELYFSKRDYKSAYKHLQDAVNKGIPKAFVKLGILLIDNPPLAEQFPGSNPIKLLETAITKGEPSAYSIIGLAYLNGSFVTANRSKAFFYFSEGAKRGDPASAYELSSFYKDENPELYFKWLEFSARRSNLEAQFKLGHHIVSTENPHSNNFENGIKWLTFSAGGGNADALALLGFINHNGLGVKKNTEIANTLFCKAAINGSHIAQKELNRQSNNNWIERCRGIFLHREINDIIEKSLTPEVICKGMADDCAKNSSIGARSQ